MLRRFGIGLFGAFFSLSVVSAAADDEPKLFTVEKFTFENGKTLAA